MLPKYIEKSSDLQTSHEDIVKGFLSQALTKTEKATPYIEQARTLSNALGNIKKIDDILNLKEWRNEIIAAAGFSDKGKSKLTSEELDLAIESVFSKLLLISENNLKEEIIYRFLLTKGDTLGGSMRNYTGASAGSKLSSLIKQNLENTDTKIKITSNSSGKIQRIEWTNRILLFDVKPKFINKNIDLILLSALEDKPFAEILETPSCYIACGELKGGIDPAGADEHWKTANSALGRIREAFEKSPSLFFIGAAIEASMAEEIYIQLEDGRLTHAANLNNEAQLSDLVDWLVNL